MEIRRGGSECARVARVVVILLLGAVSAGADADADGPLTIVAPAAPGGGWDQTARALQHALSSADPDSHVQVENVAGAAGTIGLARFVSTERGNPHALLVTGLVMLSAIASIGSPVTLADTTPIMRLTGEYEAIVVPASSPIRTLAELIARFRASPVSVTWGGGSAGGTDDLLVRLLAEAVGISPRSVNYIAFPGGGAALAALLGGRVTAGVSGYGEFAGQIEAGTLRVLAISAPSRISGIDAPTLREQGVALDLSNWRGIVAPPGLTDAERDGLIARIEQVVATDPWQATLRRNGWDDLPLSGIAFRQFLIAEQNRVAAVLQRLAMNAPDPKPTNWVMTPRTAPTVALALLALLTVAQIPRLRARASHNRRGRRALALVALLFGHAVALPVIGFVAASTALFALSAALFGSRRWVRDWAVGAALTIVLYVVFTNGLGLTLPADPVTAWLYR